ncbi:ATP-binding protein [Nocardia thailandica]|uniref:ATP-binding protein n=1 Tax=Nocardia thailandica TaxID=257275 RepID=A0ABW6PTI9_9NOCA
MTTPPPTVAERLRAARRRRFVGRAGEVALFRDALDAADPPFTVLFLHGPGGIGKTTLLAELREVAASAGARTAWIDGRTADPAPGTFHDAAAPADERFVLFVDTFERLAPLEDWLRETFPPCRSPRSSCSPGALPRIRPGPRIPAGRSWCG